MKQITYRMGELVNQSQSQRSSTGKAPPFLFVGVIGTDPKLYAQYDFDSIFLANDSGVDLYFSFDGGSSYFKLLKTEVIVWDKCTSSTSLWMYALAAGSAIRLALWAQRD